MSSPRRLSFFAAAALLAAAVAPEAQETAAVCGEPGDACRALVASECLSRVGAGSLQGPAQGEQTAAILPSCDAQLARYRDCLASISQLCAPGALSVDDNTRGVPAADMLGVWTEIKDSGDPDAFEAFARNFEGTSLAAVAEKRAAELRLAAAADAREQEAAAIWAEIKDLGDADALSQFADNYPSSPLAAEARAKSAALKQETAAPAPTAVTPQPQPLVDEARERERAERRALVRSVQTSLARLGYAPGPADGVMGEKTRSAIRAFERDAGRPDTGDASEALLAALAEAPPRPAPSAPAPTESSVAAPASTAPVIAAPPAPVVYAAAFSWIYKRSATEERSNACDTRLTLDAAGRLEGDEERCEQVQVSYSLTIDGDSAYGWIQLFSVHEGSSPRIDVSGPIGSKMLGRSARYTMRLTLTPER